MMKHGWLVYNGFFHSESFSRLFGSILSEAEALGISLRMVGNDQLCPPDAFLKAHEKPDFVLFWDKDVRLAFQLEKAGIPVFNSAKSIALCDDKTLTCLALDSAVPMPETILCPMTFYEYGDVSFLSRVEDALSFPYILKEGQGSFGQQVYLIRTHEEGVQKLRELAGKPLLFQRFVSSSFGRDLRVYVCGGQCAAAMERVAPPGDFRANVMNGGKAAAHRLSAQEERIALQAAKALGLTFAGVDLLFSGDGPLVCEVNSNAHFTAIMNLTGVRIPKLILECILNQLPENTY